MKAALVTARGKVSLGQTKCNLDYIELAVQDALDDMKATEETLMQVIGSTADPDQEVMIYPRHPFPGKATRARHRTLLPRPTASQSQSPSMTCPFTQILTYHSLHVASTQRPNTPPAPDEEIVDLAKVKKGKAAAQPNPQRNQNGATDSRFQRGPGALVDLSGQ